MTLQEFLLKYNGQYVEEAGPAALYQCVDLANRYIKEVLNLPIIAWTNAKDFPSRAGDNFEYILNTPTNVPQEGDLMIFDGTYGHISIFLEGDVNKFNSFDENWPTGSVCAVRSHNYTSPKVLGWLRGKKAPETIQPVKLLVGDQTKVEIGGDFGVMEIQAIRSTLTDLNKNYQSLKNNYASLQAYLDEKLVIIQDLTKKASEAITERDDSLAKLVTCQRSAEVGPVSPKNTDFSPNSILIGTLIRRVVDYARELLTVKKQS